MSNSGVGTEILPEETSSLAPLAQVSRFRRLIKQQTIYQAAYVRHGGGGWCEECQQDNCEKSQFQRHVLHDLKHNNGLPSHHDADCPCVLPEAAA